MYRTPDHDSHSIQLELQAAEAELADLNKHLRTFEAQVDARLGNWLDQLSELNAETEQLNEQLRHIREENLFGADLMKYHDGAPQPGRPTRLDSLPPQGLQFKQVTSIPDNAYTISAGTPLPDIKTLYRRLARRYHPDLARSAADRVQANDQMKAINLAYAAGDLPALMRLAGLSLPCEMDFGQPTALVTGATSKPADELGTTQSRLQDVRRQINQLSNLPIVKLSLDVKLARHQGRDLLHELSAELQYKVARKIAERDYLRSQIEASQSRSKQG
jgi:hypothetical protein